MKLSFITLLVVGATMLPAAAQIADNTPIIEAAGQAMTKAEFEALLTGDQRYIGFAKDAAGRQALGTSFGRAFALEAEAKRRKLDQAPDVQLKIRHAIQQMLAYELTLQLRKDYLRDEARLAAHYESNKTFFSQPRVRQILVRMKGSEVSGRAARSELTSEQAAAKAAELRAKLVAGADFAELAKAESDDLGTLNKGGDLGFLLRGASPAEVEAVAFSLPVGQISAVIRTELGFHILRVDDRQAPQLADVKAVLANDLAHRDIERIVESGYKLNMAYFKP